MIEYLDTYLKFDHSYSMVEESRAVLNKRDVFFWRMLEWLFIFLLVLVYDFFQKLFERNLGTKETLKLSLSDNLKIEMDVVK